MRLTKLARLCALFVLLAALFLNTFAQEAAKEAEQPPLWMPWQEVTVQVGNERDGFNDSIQARATITNPEAYDGCMAIPYMSKVPDKENCLLLTMCGGLGFRIHKLLESTDEGETWHDLPGAEPKAGTGLTACGNGVILLNDGYVRSEDFGKTWQYFQRPSDPRFGTPIYGWDPALIDPASNGQHLYLTGHYCRDFNFMEERLIPCIRESFDAGKTWTAWQGIPEFVGCNEVALAYNAKGEIVCGIRASTMMSPSNDQSDRLETSYSTDGGKTWAATTVVAGNGRHHPCLVLLPDGRMVMTYVVRLGYADVDGKFAYGIEAVVSYDDGHTWDTDHRYILSRWTHDCMFRMEDGSMAPMEHYYGAPQCTSTVYLPESDCLVTVYGTAQNADHRTPARHVAPFQTGMIKWKPLPKESYSGVKTPPPAPIPADEALRQIQYNKYWPVNYVAKTGLPDCGWKDSYPRGQPELRGEWLHLDHHVNKGGIYSVRGIDALEKINAPFGARMRLNVPVVQDSCTKRLHVYGILGTGQDKFTFFIAIDDHANISGGTFGEIPLPAEAGKPFQLDVWVDNLSRTARFWVDGQLAAEKQFEPQYVNPKQAEVLYFGAGSNAIGGIIEVGEFKLGLLR